MRVEIPSSSATALRRKIITYAIYNTEPISKSLKTLHIQNIIKPPSLYLTEISDHFVKQRKCIMCLLQVKKMEKSVSPSKTVAFLTGIKQIQSMH